MYTMKDGVLDHAKLVKEKGTTSTDDGIQLLEIANAPENFSAGNLYIVALRIISQLIDEVKGIRVSQGVTPESAEMEIRRRIRLG